MTKNTAYYKAAFAKSEAASPYAKMNPHMKGHGMHNPSMKMNHGSAMEMNHGSAMEMNHSAMEKHDPTHMKMGHEKTTMKKYGTHTKMAGKSHMKGKVQGKGTHEDHHKDVTDREGKFPKDQFERAIEKKLSSNE
tara:strand:- start:336 stop:740 length:405 start_codon:yes stop_codon:yes gene_type:complete